jgi:hypothetical protein
MIKKLLGYTIAGIGFIGIGFFRYYKGDLIPYTTLWFILSFVVLFIGFYVATTGKSKKELVSEIEYSKQRDKLITTGDQIKINIDNCEIKENNYYQDTSDNRYWKAQAIDAAFDPNRNFQEQYIDQSAIIYHHKNGDKTEKYVSQAFPFSTESLTLHILNNDIILYIDKFDRKNYLFDFKNT